MSAARRSLPADAARGALMGAAEVVPGVSGGTVALVVGVYAELLAAIDDVLTAARTAVRGDVARAKELLRGVPWRLVLPLGVGMVAAVLVGARVLEPLLEDEPVLTRAAFAGLVLASVGVPARMVGRWGAREAALAVVAAVAAVVLTGLPPGADVDPPLVVVVGAAALAICALVLPGVSGSFLLLSIGLYEPTLAALNSGDVAYVACFLLGALLGIGAFVKVLRWLLREHAAPTLAVMTGLMVGSLRALWPWQSDDRDLLAPTSQVPGAVLVFAVGVAVVGGLLLLERRAVQRELEEAQEDAPSSTG